MTRIDLLVGLLRAAAARGWKLARLDGAAAGAPLTGHDADLLAAWRPWADWRALVLEQAESLGWRLVMSIPKGSCLLLFLARNDAGEFLQVDLHRALSARGIPFADPACLFAAARIEDGACRLDAEDARSVRALEYKLSHGRSRSADIQVARRHQRAAFGILPPGRLSALVMALLCRPVLLLRLLLAKLADGLGRFWRPPGVLWTLSGPDGAGKTSLLDSLGWSVPRQLAAGIRVLHTRPFLWPRRSRGLPPVAGTAMERPHGKLRSWLRWGLAWLDFRLGHWLHVWPHLVAGRLVLFDRYGFDYIVASRRRGIDLGDAAVRRLAAAAAPPLGALFLIADPAELVSRKGEATLAEATRQVAAYRALAATVPNSALIDTGDLGPVAVTRAALIHIVGVMADHARSDHP